MALKEKLTEMSVCVVVIKKQCFNLVGVYFETEMIPMDFQNNPQSCRGFASSNTEIIMDFDTN